MSQLVVLQECASHLGYFFLDSGDQTQALMITEQNLYQLTPFPSLSLPLFKLNIQVQFRSEECPVAFL